MIKEEKVKELCRNCIIKLYEFCKENDIEVTTIDVNGPFGMTVFTFRDRNTNHIYSCSMTKKMIENMCHGTGKNVAYVIMNRGHY